MKRSTWETFFPAVCVVVLAIDVAVFVSRALLSGVGIASDNYNLGYPLRVLVSTAIRNGVFPFWDHWTYGGAPLISIYMTSALSPVVWLLSLFGIYTPQSFVAEILIVHLLGCLGMYAWLRLHAGKGIAVYGALAYALSQYMLLQFPINIEAGASPSLYPWYAFGLTMTLRGHIRGVALTALSLFVMFTVGYLGTNIIALQFITLYCAMAYWLERPHLLAFTRADMRGCGLALLAFAAFALAANLLFSETVANQPLGYFLNRSIDPYLAATRGRSLVMFLFPNGLSPFEPDAYDGNLAPFYVGVFSVFFMVYAMCHGLRNRQVKLLLIFALLSWLAILSKYHPVARAMVDVIPFYSRVRFHVWNGALVLFFCVTLASLGARLYFEGPGRLMHKAAFFVFLALLPVAFAAKPGATDWPDFFAHYQIYFLPLYFVCLCRFRKLGEDARMVLLSLLLLGEVYVVQGECVKFPHGVRLCVEVSSPGFPPPPNRRVIGDLSQYNGHLLSKVPHVVGYMPQIHPLIAALSKDQYNLNLLVYTFYPAGEDRWPRFSGGERIAITVMDPNRIEAVIETSNERATYVWSSPFSPNWRLEINGVPTVCRQNRYGLTEFEVHKGRNVVSFVYRPWYMTLSLVIMGVTLATLVALLCWRYRGLAAAPATRMSCVSRQ